MSTADRLLAASIIVLAFAVPILAALIGTVWDRDRRARAELAPPPRTYPRTHVHILPVGHPSRPVVSADEWAAAVNDEEVA